MDERKLFLLLKRPLALIFFSMLALMFIYEFIKQVLNPSITIWESHLITIIFTSVVAVIISYFPLRSTYNEREKARVTEAALKESEAESKNILRTAMDGFCIVGPAGSLFDVNDAFCTMTGYSRDELLTMSLADIEVKETKTDIAGHIQEIIRKGADRFESQYRCRDGSIINVEISVVHSETHSRHFVVFIHDITNRKRAEEVLKSSDARMRAMLESIIAGVVIIDPDTHTIVDANAVAARMIGAEKEAIIGSFCHKYICPAEVGSCPISDLNQVVDHSEKLLIHADGTTSPILKSVVPVRLNDRTYLLESFIDISDIRKAEDALRESEEKYRMLAELSSDMITIFDLNGVISYASPAVRSILGYTPEEIIGKNAFDFSTGIDKEEQLQMFHEFKAGKRDMSKVQVQLPKKDGTFVIVENVISPIFEEGTLTGLLLVGRDITGRMRAEDALRESEEKFRGVAERSSDIIQLTDTTGRITYVSPSIKRILGFDPDEVIGTTPDDIVHPDDNEVVQELIRKNMAGSPVIEAMETRVRKKGGGYATLDVIVSPVIKDGVLSGMQVMARDITETKAAQSRIDELLRIQEEQVEIINTSPAVAFIWKAEENWPVETVSKNISRFGYTPEDLISGRVMYSSIIHPDDLGRVAAEVEHNSTHHIDTFYQVYRIFGKDHEVFWIEDFTRIRRDSAGTITHYQGIVLDITDRKLAEMERDRLVSVIRHSGELVGLSTPDRKIMFLNEAGAKMLGIDPAEALGQDFSEFVPDHLKENLHSVLLPALIEHGRWEGDLQYRNVKTGNLLDVHAMTFLIGDPATGAPQFLATVSLDITDRKLAEEALKESEEKFRMIFETSNDPILLLEVLPGGMPGHFLDVNEVAIKKLGYTKEELLSLPVTRINSPELNLKLPAILQELVKKGYSTFEDEIMTKSGAMLPVEANVQLVKIHDLPVIITIARDITERKKAEAELKKYSETLEEMVAEQTKELRETQEQLVKKEKLAVLGKLAGGVGHELRNPLGAIKNAAYFLNMVLENPEPDVKETLEIMNTEVARSEDILSSLLDFARPTVLMLRKVRINDVIDEAVARNPIAENITLIRNLDETLPEIMADPDKLLQVFTNLVTNACQAMPAGGSLTLQSALQGQDQVMVSVTDTGVGISEEHMKRLFEPLFSTKAKGIGLGLVVTKSIVDAHNGSIGIRSGEGKGTTFTVTLPVGIEGETVP